MSVQNLLLGLFFLLSTSVHATEYQCSQSAKRMAGTLYTQATGIKYDQAVITAKTRKTDGSEIFEIAVYTYARYNIKYRVSATYQDWAMDRCNIHYIEEI